MATFGIGVEQVAQQLVDAFGNRLGAITTVAAHLYLGLRAADRQAVEQIAQAVEQGVGAVMAADLQFVPAVEHHLIEGQYQVLAHPRIAQRIGAPGGHVHVHLAVLPERVYPDIDQQQHLAGNAGAQQGGFFDAGLRQGEALLQAGDQVGQFEIGQVAGARMQRQARAAVDHAVAMAPGEQFDQFARAL